MSYRSLILKLFPRWWNLPSVLSPLAFFCRAKAGISIFGKFCVTVSCYLCLWYRYKVLRNICIGILDLFFTSLQVFNQSSLHNDTSYISIILYYIKKYWYLNGIYLTKLRKCIRQWKWYKRKYFHMEICSYVHYFIGNKLKMKRNGVEKQTSSLVMQGYFQYS